ncbi:thioesterase family protein [Ferrovibrio sp. MS7]|jgi:YbgC/YbaW family acyl-CoA thioester hydrolase|uniref:acyl-CoA thioesterase n=1 Tax=Ferrovibrio plantarum TaxID=3119164 RepID=UPI001B7868B9|nr:acyl-CoA thioesterase [Ferrovibrio sp.]
MKPVPPPYSPDRLFAIERVVQWGEADPAGIVYTTQFLDYVIETVESFWREQIGCSWYHLHKRHNLGSPTVSSKLDFQKPLRAADPFTVELRIPRLTRSTITFHIVGRNAAGESCFTGELVSCIIDDQAVRSVTIPDWIRQPIEAYRTATAQEDMP